MIALSIIILSYNTKNLLRDCLTSILSSIDGKFLHEVIVVDNASSDGSADMVKQEFKKVKIIENNENLGFAKGCNIGATFAKGKYILFLNSDTEVKDRGFLKMVEFLEKNNNIGILGGKLLNSNGSSQSSGGNFYNLWNLFLMLIGGERFGLGRISPTKVEKVDWVSGACMMIRKELFQKLSGFDEHFFMYMEDMEICFRAQKMNFATYFYPNIRLKHKSLGSSNRTFAIINIYKGILHFYSKHKSGQEYLVAKTLLVTKAIFLILVGALTLNKNLRDRYKEALKF